MNNKIFEQNLKNNEGNENLEENLKNQEELVKKNVNEMKEVLDSVGGVEGLQEKADYIGEDKVKEILVGMKKVGQKIIDVVKYTIIPTLSAGAVGGLAVLNNMSSIETVNPIVLASGAFLAVSTIEAISVASSKKGERKKEEASGIKIAA